VTLCVAEKVAVRNIYLTRLDYEFEVAEEGDKGELVGIPGYEVMKE